jgi:hypothetical protein
VIACSPLLYPLARFFFDDLKTFMSEAGLDDPQHRVLWLLGWPRMHLQFGFKAIGFLAIFGAVVFAVYSAACKILY